MARSARWAGSWSFGVLATGLALALSPDRAMCQEGPGSGELKAVEGLPCLILERGEPAAPAEPPATALVAASLQLPGDQAKGDAPISEAPLRDEHQPIFFTGCPAADLGFPGSQVLTGLSSSLESFFAPDASRAVKPILSLSPDILPNSERSRLLMKFGLIANPREVASFEAHLEGSSAGTGFIF